MWWLIACFTNSGPDSGQDTSSSPSAVTEAIIPSGPSKATAVCDPMIEQHLTIGLSEKDCGANELNSNLKVVITQMPFIQGETFSFERPENSATWHVGDEIIPIISGQIVLEWEGMWSEGTSFFGDYQAEAEDGTLLEGFVTGVTCSICTIQPN